MPCPSQTPGFNVPNYVRYEFSFSISWKYMLYVTADTDSGGHHTDEETGYNSRNHSPTSVKGREGSDGSNEESEKPASAAKPVDKRSDDEEEENGVPFLRDDSPKSDVVMKEELPPYLPAIQGCRSVEEFQCLNRDGMIDKAVDRFVISLDSDSDDDDGDDNMEVEVEESATAHTNSFMEGVCLLPPSPAEFRSATEIEEGTYGVVYRARDKRTEEVVALKRLKMEKEKEGFPITSLREINTLLKAQHPNIVTVREIVVGSNMDKIFIVMDYVEHDLKSLMETMKQKKQVFIPGEVKCLMQQLLRAVAHLHDNWILHRDLKTSNLLLSHKGILKVGDFGLAREYGSPLKAYTPIVVTLWYRAPELLLCTKEYSTPVDMWSVGCIFGEFLSMEALFPGKSEVDQLNRIFKNIVTAASGFERVSDRACGRRNAGRYDVARRKGNSGMLGRGREGEVSSWCYNIVRNGTIKFGDLSFEEVEKFKYLGATVTNVNDTWEEIKRRINMGNACYYSVEKLLSSSLLSKNLKVRIYKTTILPVVLYGCETWTLTLREEQRLRVFENKVLRKIFGAKRDEVTGEWIKLHSAELHALYPSPDIIRNIKSRRLRWAGHGAWMGESRNAYRVLVGMPET
ncbi:hypothetical protein ANN_19559 [Periplaneta americana]|uniref:Protein kinase domain-containing protein n=1 Tax=Periplaneta americana TaxID=6978 RepID=A0ABQ8SAV7_PERAM|nr:hypothetical protein ANN_19559 [Periplaneta americana]